LKKINSIVIHLLFNLSASFFHLPPLTIITIFLKNTCCG